MQGGEGHELPNVSHELHPGRNACKTSGNGWNTSRGFHMSRFGAGAVLAVSTKIKILGSCIDESPKGFGSI